MGRGERAESSRERGGNGGKKEGQREGREGFEGRAQRGRPEWPEGGPALLYISALVLFSRSLFFSARSLGPLGMNLRVDWSYS